MKDVFLTLCCVALAAIVFSCKHTPIDGANTGGPRDNSGGAAVAATCSPDTVYFQQQILPLLVSNCAMSGCHDAASHQDGVVLTDYARIMTTGDVRAGQPTSSKLWKMINETDPSKRMPRPPASPLTAAQKDAIFKWISQGARNSSCQAAACDTVAVTYTGAIRSLLATNCTGCHSGTAPQGGINLTTHAGVKAKVTDGRLWGAINHSPGFSSMPKGGTKLSGCEIKQVKKWMDAGAPNN